MSATNSQSRQPLRWRLGTRAALFAACFGIAACDSSGGQAPGAVSEGEARALEEAAEMLDERRLPEGVVPDPDAPVAVEQADTAELDASEASAE